MKMKSQHGIFNFFASDWSQSLGACLAVAIIQHLPSGCEIMFD